MSNDTGTSYRHNENTAACAGRWDLFDITHATKDTIRRAIQLCDGCPLRGNGCVSEGDDVYGTVRDGWVYDQKGVRRLPEKYIARNLDSDYARLLAEALRHRGDPTKCGSEGGYLRHLRRGEICDECRAAHAAYGTAMKAAARALKRAEREPAA